MTTRVFILRVGREHCAEAEAALAMTTNLQDTTKSTEGYTMSYCPAEKCRVRVLHISGTLDKVENHYKQMSEAWLESMQKKSEML